MHQQYKHAMKRAKVAYGAADLKGLKVMHSSKAFEEHTEVILTLVDSSILQTDENGKVIGINEEDSDMLENVNLAEEDRRNDRQKRMKRNRQPVYSGYDDAEFEEGIAPGAMRSILAHYDKDQKSGPKFSLGEGGVAVIGETSSNGAVAPSARLYQSLKVEAKPASSFMSFNDIKARKSSRMKEGARKQPIRPRVSEKEEEEFDLTKMLDPSAPAAAENAMNVIESKPVKVNKQRIVNRQVVEEKEEDEDLLQALARARALAVKKNLQEQETNGEKDKGARFAFDLLKDAGRDVQDQEEGEGGLEDEVDTEGRRADGSIVFNSTMEFSTRLQATLNERARVRTEAAVKDMERSVDAATQELASHRKVTKQRSAEEGDEEGGKSGAQLTISSSQKSKRMDVGTSANAGWEGLQDEELSVSMDGEEESGEEGDEDDEQLGFLHSQPLASKGMGAALALLRGSGDLSHKEGLAGRAKDNRAYDPSAADHGVKLEYRDKHGQKLTQKEAFRQLSYRFHGYGPGKKKKEKKLKAMAVQVAATSSRTGILDGAAGTMKSLTTAQAATGKAHIVVQGGAHASASQLAKMVATAMAKKKS